MKQDKENKLNTLFDPRPYEVTNKKGNMVPAQREDKQITGNSSKFKSVLNPPDLPGTDETEGNFIKDRQENTDTRKND